MIPIGTILRGFCNGYFGRASYSDKRVEAVGADWIVARDDDGRALFADLSGASATERERLIQNWIDGDP